MKIISDCKAYIKDNSIILNTLKNNNFISYERFIDPLNIIKHINKKYDNNEKIDEDYITIYYQAFTYLYNCLETFKIYYKNYFNQTITRIKKYDLLINYILYLDDLIEQSEDESLKGFLLAESNKLEKKIIENKEYTIEELNDLDDKLYIHISEKDLFSSQEIFGLIAEEMGLD